MCVCSIGVIIEYNRAYKIHSVYITSQCGNTKYFKIRLNYMCKNQKWNLCYMSICNTVMFKQHLNVHYKKYPKTININIIKKNHYIILKEEIMKCKSKIKKLIKFCLYTLLKIIFNGLK